jgi:hypothetical protein
MEETKILDSAEERASRAWNPFTKANILKENVHENKYTDDFNQAFKILFARRLSFREITKKLQIAFPGYVLNTDKVKNYYLRFREDFLKARDETDGVIADLQEAEEEAILAKAMKSETNLVDQLIDRREELLSALNSLDPDENTRSYGSLVQSIERLSNTIERSSGLKALREVNVIRQKMKMSIEMKEIMIKKGLVSPPATAISEAEIVHAGESIESRQKPTIIDAEES